MKKERRSTSPNNITTKSAFDEIWEAHVRGELVGEEYGRALRGLVGRRVRAMARRQTSITTSKK